MANQIALKTHTQPGDEVIIHPLAHLVRAESGGGAALSGVQFRTLGNPDGTLPLEQVAGAIYRGDNPHYPPTTLICLENTHNVAGGTVLPVEHVEAVSAGARVLNAAVALDIQPERITRHVDTTTLCLSKGLGAPVGSVVAGSRAFIARALRFRKMYGGGMRQAGFLAAAGRYALRHHVARLAEDHANARLFADGLAANPHLELANGPPQTNIVFFRSRHPRITLEQLIAGLARRGVLIGGAGAYGARAVTHLDVDRAGIERALAAFHEVLAA